VIGVNGFITKRLLRCERVLLRDGPSDGETIVLNPITAVPATGTTPDGSAAPQGRSTNTGEATSSGSQKLVTTANPSYVLDLGLGLVVLQYYDQSGNVTSSIPSERQLQAYRDGGVTPGVTAAAKS
jgi:hypothetical protein